AQIILDIRGGTGADIIFFDGFWVSEFASAGLLEPLDAYLKTWKDWPQYLKSMQSMGSYQGKTYLIPAQTDVRGIYYRKDLFKQAGLPENWAPKSYADIYAAGEALKKIQGVTPIQWNGGTSFGEAATLQGFYMALLSAGGNLYNFSRQKWVVGGPQMTNALNFYRELYVNRKLADVNLQLDPKGRDRSFELFRDGKIGIYPEGTYMWLGVTGPGAAWEVKNRNEVIGWAPMPTSNGDGKIVTISGGGGHILNKNSQNKELAFEVLTRLNSMDSLNTRATVATFIPARQDAWAAVFKADPEIQRQIRTAMPVTTFRPSFPVYTKVSEQVQQMTEKVIRGVPVAQALADYAKAVTALVGAGNTTTFPR
ncbi:MAG TPA: extracellular solute-binding protein, partial [Deinococcales bacterium]|nr:extracellular solute-binding protein [Deinococcales bacterium]